MTTRSAAHGLALVCVLSGCHSAAVAASGQDAASTNDAALGRGSEGGTSRADAASNRHADGAVQRGSDAAIAPTEAGPSFPGTTAGALAAGGQRSTSPHYQFIGTLGQTPAGNGVSPSARMNGGVVGATQQQP
jgi:hypothetical protein